MLKNSNVNLIGINGRLLNSFVEKNKNNWKDTILTGTPQENLCEYAGRMCYKSQFKDGKKTRTTPDYHKHIREVGHHSIYGHAVETFRVKHKDLIWFCWEYAHFPGWYVSQKEGLLTVNYRFIENILRKFDSVYLSKKTEDVVMAILGHFRDISPNIFKPVLDKYPNDLSKNNIEYIKNISDFDTEIKNQKWYSFEINTSRRVAQELTRHGFETAISMESTRYVDQIDNQLILSPYLEEVFDKNDGTSVLTYYDLYKDYREKMNKIIQGDKFYVKKQAQGSAAAFLPLGLETTLIMSFSEREIKNVYSQRINNSADKEIQILVSKMKRTLEQYEDK